MKYILRVRPIEDSLIYKNDGTPMLVKWSYWREFEDWGQALELIKTGDVEEVMEVD